MVSWEKICRPKSEGGLGFHNLKILNQAHMMKLAWSLLVEKDKLWVKILQANMLVGLPWSLLLLSVLTPPLFGVLLSNNGRGLLLTLFGWFVMVKAFVFGEMRGSQGVGLCLSVLMLEGRLEKMNSLLATTLKMASGNGRCSETYCRVPFVIRSLC